jgi:hypothetical protein
MGATDTSPTRLDEAKRQVIALIEQMKPENAAMVISFSNVARVEQPFTNSRRLLRQRVELISQTNRPSDLNEALRAAAGLANPGQSGDPNNPEDAPAAEAMPATLYIFSDGGVGAVPKFKLGNLEPLYVKVGEETQANVAIASFSTDVNPEKPGQIQAFARLENFSSAEASVEASLFLNDTLLDAQKITVPPRGEKGLPGASGARFEMNNAIESGVLKLVLDSKDNLTVDNTAFAVVNLPHPAKVLVVTPGNDALELALGTDEAKKIADVSFAEPKLLETKAYADQATEGAFDLVIYDQCAPKTMPNCNTLFIGRLPPTGWVAKAPRQGPPLVIDTDQVHPLTQLVQMGNVKIVEATPLTGPQGTITLIDADIGPIYAIGPRAGYEDAVLAFELVTYTPDGKREVNTDWPIRRSFPVFVMNAVKYLGGVRSSLAAPNIKPGQPAILRTAIPVDSVVVQSPRKDRFDVPKESSNTYIFGRTDELGVYDVREGSGVKVSQQFAVNLYDTRESDLKPKDIVIGVEELKGQTGKKASRQELWKWLLLAAIGVLIFEWYIYNRRVYL